MSKVVFVGNVPYHMGEEQLIEAFKSVGQVVGFRLVYDRDTGKPKGYGFCEFADHDTAMSAVRNLNNQEVGGRPLRIDLADSDPFLEGKTTVRGELVDSQETRAQWRERERDRENGGFKSRESKSFLTDLPPGVPVPPGKTAGDLITEVLATTPPAQIFEVLAQMKASRAFVITHPEQAKALLVAHPQLGYAMFQALLVNKIVDTAVLERMLAATTGAAPPPPSGAPPSYHQPPLQHPQPGFNQPPQGMGMPPPHLAGPHHPTPPLPGAPGSMYGAPPGPSQAHMPPPQYYRPPVPAPAPVPTPPVPAPAPVAAATPAPAGTQSLDPSARDMLMQVLNLTSEQVASLPAPERDQINQLRKQFNMPPLS